MIDEEEVGEGRSGGNQKSINVVSPFYIGALPRDPRETLVMAASNMDVSYTASVGLYKLEVCLKPRKVHLEDRWCL